jgi:hypothetical protein
VKTLTGRAGSATNKANPRAGSAPMEAGYDLERDKRMAI